MQPESQACRVHGAYESRRSSGDRADGWAEGRGGRGPVEPGAGSSTVVPELVPTLTSSSISSTDTKTSYSTRTGRLTSRGVPPCIFGRKLGSGSSLEVADSSTAWLPSLPAEELSTSPGKQTDGYGIESRADVDSGELVLLSLAGLVGRVGDGEEATQVSLSSSSHPHVFFSSCVRRLPESVSPSRTDRHHHDQNRHLSIADNIMLEPPNLPPRASTAAESSSLPPPARPGPSSVSDIHQRVSPLSSWTVDPQFHFAPTLCACSCADGIGPSPLLLLDQRTRRRGQRALGSRPADGSRLLAPLLPSLLRK